MKDTVILVTNNGMGKADEKLQQLLFGMRNLESQGVRLIICSTC